MRTASFEKSYASLTNIEGGWVNHKADRGGETYAGIARKIHPDWSGWEIVDKEKSHSSFSKSSKAFSAHLAANSILSEMVKDWFYVNWWLALSLDAFPLELAEEVFEQSINLGKGQAGKHLQRICNAWNLSLNGKGALFHDLVEDGMIGAKTVAAVKKILSVHNNLTVMVRSMNRLQGTFYILLAARNPSQRVFTTGWMKRTFDTV